MSDEMREAFEKIDKIQAQFEQWAILGAEPYSIKQLPNGFYESGDTQNAFYGFHGATAAADAEWRGVVEVMRDALELAKPCVKPMRIQAVEAQIDKALAQAAELLGRK